MSKVCTDCKWGVVGKYSHIYKGCPIGCQRPNNERQYKEKGLLGCFEPKESAK